MNEEEYEEIQSEDRQKMKAFKIGRERVETSVGSWQWFTIKEYRTWKAKNHITRQRHKTALSQFGVTQ